MDTVKHSDYRFGHGSDDAHKKDQALFSKLLENHQQLRRETEKLPNGIRAITESENTDLVKTLQAHAIGMEKRFEQGRAIRSWDPLFAALFEYKDQMQMHYEMTEKGVCATLTADDPKLIELIHCHDLTIHGFINRGFDAGGEKSPKPEWLD